VGDVVAAVKTGRVEAVRAGQQSGTAESGRRRRELWGGAKKRLTDPAILRDD